MMDGIGIPSHEWIAETFVRADLEKPRTLPFGVGRVHAFVGPRPGRTSPNEDSAAVFVTGPNSGVLVVADGVGGERAGDRASALAIESFAESLREVDPNATDLRPAVLDGFERANDAIRALGIGAATTLAVAEVHGREVRPYHVGDSAILLVGQRGRVKLRAMPHSPVGHAIEAGLLHPDDAMTHEERHLVSNLVGTGDMRIEMGTRQTMAARDTLILASDGLTDNLTEPEIVGHLRCGPLGRRLATVVAETRTRMGLVEPNGVPSKPDDLTILAYRASPVRKRRAPSVPIPPEPTVIPVPVEAAGDRM